MLARAALIAALFVMPAAILADDAATSFRALLVEYRCPVVDRLEQTYAAIDRAIHRTCF
jgi:hypothetical protein